MSLLIKEILNYLITFSILFGFFSIIVLVFSYMNAKRRQFMMVNFANYLVALEYSQEKAYDMIHKDRLLIYSAEGVKVDDSEFEIISKEYANLVFKLMGDTVKEEILALYGLDALTLNMMEYFNTRYEDDEIRKDSVESMMDKDSLIDEDNKS